MNTSGNGKHPWAFLGRVLSKTLILFVIFNLLFLWLNPLPLIGPVSGYNLLFPGRKRLPFGEDIERSYNISILQLEAMINSHVISSGEKPEDEFRVLLMGDSSVWGFLLPPDQTLSAVINEQNIRREDGGVVRAYNLGYPTLSLTKDLLFLDMGLRYEPDLILWFITLEALPLKKQLTSPVVQYNPELVNALLDAHSLQLPSSEAQFIEPTFRERTIFGQRRALADWIRLQLLGVMWAATGIDHDVPENYDRPAEDQSSDLEFQGFKEGEMTEADLGFEFLSAGVNAAGDIPVIFINQPIFIAQGENSEIRYNEFYPRWAYDAYRQMLVQVAAEQGWDHVDLWDAVPAEAYTDSAIHYSPRGVQAVVEKISQEILLPAK